jgi:hypothetical protein
MASIEILITRYWSLYSPNASSKDMRQLRQAEVRRLSNEACLAFELLQAS